MAIKMNTIEFQRNCLGIDIMERLFLCLASWLLSSCVIGDKSTPRLVQDRPAAAFFDENSGEAVVQFGNRLEIMPIENFLIVAGELKYQFTRKEKSTNSPIQKCVYGFGFTISSKIDAKTGETFRCNNYSMRIERCLQKNDVYGVSSCTKFYISVACKHLTDSCNDIDPIDDDGINKFRIIGYIIDKSRGVLQIDKFDLNGNIVNKYTKVYGQLF